ncbi:hypothetical protein OL229_09285 [Neisseriaceae bacterium JH1-16]|nr:hypothetical protein [Neisseriaceae bacterium JH1-16]
MKVCKKPTKGDVPITFRLYVRNCWVAEDQVWNSPDHCDKSIELDEGKHRLTRY